MDQTQIGRFNFQAVGKYLFNIFLFQHVTWQPADFHYRVYFTAQACACILNQKARVKFCAHGSQNYADRREMP